MLTSAGSPSPPDPLSRAGGRRAGRGRAHPVVRPIPAAARAPGADGDPCRPTHVPPPPECRGGRSYARRGAPGPMASSTAGGTANSASSSAVKTASSSARARAAASASRYAAAGLRSRPALAAATPASPASQMAASSRVVPELGGDRQRAQRLAGDDAGDAQPYRRRLLQVLAPGALDPPAPLAPGPEGGEGDAGHGGDPAQGAAAARPPQLVGRLAVGPGVAGRVAIG